MRPLALVLAFSVALAAPARAETPLCEVPSATGPSVRIRLLGVDEGEGAQGRLGYFYPDEQVVAIARRVVACERARDALAVDLGKCDVDRRVQATKARLGWKFWSAIVGVALTSGIAAGRALR
jgi:hypothetical protein